MADTIEALKDKLQALEADSGGNKDRKKLEVALELFDADHLVAAREATERFDDDVAHAIVPQAQIVSVGQLTLMDAGNQHALAG